MALGEFENERASGYGVYNHSNGSKYEGAWLDDSQHGTGIECWIDKSIYKGEYYKGKKHGLGN